MASRAIMAGQLIVHADDFGETKEITAGIWQAIHAGAVSSTTIMTNMPGTEYALRLARDCPGSVSFGLHINLCEGVPLTRCRTLADKSGRFVPKRELALRSLSGQLDPREVEAEVQAQAERLRDGGIRISHFDGHKHLHQLPGVFEPVARVAERFGVKRIRRAVVRRPSQLRRTSTVVRELLGWRAGWAFSRAGLRFPARVVDLQAIMGDVGKAPRLMSDPATVEVFCHPGTEAAHREKPGSCERSRELQFLLSDCWRETIQRSGMRLVSYWEL